MARFAISATIFCQSGHLKQKFCPNWHYVYASTDICHGGKTIMFFRVAFGGEKKYICQNETATSTET